MLDNLLFYKLCIFNFLSLCAVYAVYQLGYVQLLLQRDGTGILYGIFFILGLGILFTLIRGWKASQLLNEIKRMGHVDILKVRKMPHKNEYLNDMVEWALLVGLFGNALGFIIALGSRDDLLAGAGVAFGSTVAGILTALWLKVNFAMLRTATALLLEDAEYASESAR